MPFIASLPLFQRRQDERTRVARLEAELTTATARSAHRFLIRTGRTTYFIDAAAVDWVESADNYARLWTAGKSHLIRESMRAIDSALASHGFMRIHRQAIVNLRRLKEIRSAESGGFLVVLVDGSRIPLSRGRRTALLEALRVGTYTSGIS